MSNVLFVEKPFAAAIDPNVWGRFCFTCFLETKLSRCGKCKEAFYCSTECQKIDWDTGQHKFECKIFRTSTQIDDLKLLAQCRLVGRIIARQVTTGNCLLEHELIGYPKIAKRRQLTDLLARQELVDPNDVENFLDFYGPFKPFDKFSPEDVCKVIAMIRTNAFAISRFSLDGEQVVGQGLYLNACQFDHSCKPNLDWYNDGSKMIFKIIGKQDSALTPQIFSQFRNSYWNLYGYSAVPFREIRQSVVLKDSGFLCECDLCKDDREENIRQLSIVDECEKCKQPLVLCLEKPAAVCPFCNSTKSLTEDKHKKILECVEPCIQALQTHEPMFNCDSWDKMYALMKIQFEPHLHSVKNCFLLNIRETMLQEFLANVPTEQYAEVVDVYEKVLTSYKAYGVRSWVYPIMAQKCGFAYLKLQNRMKGLEWLNESRRLLIELSDKDNVCVKNLDTIIHSMNVTPHSK